MPSTQTPPDKLFDADREQHLRLFLELEPEDRLQIIHQLHKDGDLNKILDLFEKLDTAVITELLHELESDICQEIFDELGSEKRLTALRHLHATDETNDLQAALNAVKASDAVALLLELEPSDRRDTFELCDGDLQVDILLQLHKAGQQGELERLLKGVDPADIADFLEDLDDDERDAVFHFLGKADQADALVELEAPVAADVIEDMDNAEFVSLATHMAADEIVELLNDLDDDDRTAAILEALPQEQRQEVQELLSYEEDSAGEIMTPETCAMLKTATVAEARQALTAIETDDPIHYVYVTNPDDESLIGVVSLMDVIKAEGDVKLGDICDDHPVYTTPDEDQEDVARKFRKYDLWVMPVVDHEKKLIGRITVDDVMDVMQEEADEDLAHLVGAPDIEDEDDSPFHISRKRLPWLMITMFAGLINSVIIGSMMSLTNIQAIAIFVPAILAMGGNTGMQSSAVCIRGIALGMEKYRHLRQIVQREILVGLCLGTVCGITSAVVVFSVLHFSGHAPSGLSPLRLGIVVGISMLNAMAFAASFGALTPIILHRLGVDPAVASGPFVTTSNDLSASCIYFLTCWLLLMPAVG